MRAGIRDWAARDADRPAILIDGKKPMTYGELEQLANRYANLFAKSGLQRGDHVAMLLGNGVDGVAMCWGAYRSGLYLTPMPTTLGPVETAHIVNNSTAKMVIAAAQYGDVAGALPGLCASVQHFLSLFGQIDGFVALDELLSEMPDTARAGENPGSLMMYSSGTTGAPKGIIRPLPDVGKMSDQLPPFARDLMELFGMTADTRYLSTAPLYHAAALRFVLAITAAGGFAVVQPKFDAARALALIDAHELNLSQWVPTMFRRLLALPQATRAAFQGRFHSRAIHGAAPCTPTLKREMIDWWGPIIEEYYSGSEGVGLTAITSTEWQLRPGSVGLAKKGIVHILGPQDQQLAAGETGRVFFSGIAPFGYFNDATKTASKTSQQGYQTFGDIGHLDADGYLFLSDRLDDMIISGGVNIYPQEIEAAIEEADFIAECGVVGAPDIDFDERPIAFVVPATGVPPDDLLVRLQSHIKTRLGRLKHPRDIYIVNTLPHSATGKLLRRQLRLMLPETSD